MVSDLPGLVVESAEVGHGGSRTGGDDESGLYLLGVDRGGRQVEPDPGASSPSSGAMSTRSPTTRSCLGEIPSSVGRLPFDRGLGLMHGDQIGNAKMPRGGRKAQRYSSPTFPPKSTAQRRGQRDVAGIDVHHFRQHHDVRVGVIGLEVEHRHPRAESDAIARRFGVGELTQLVEPLVQLPQPRLNELLSLEGGLVFGVFAKVAQLHRLGDGLRQKNIELVAELVDFATQLLPHFTDHGEPGVKKEIGLEMAPPQAAEYFWKDTTGVTWRNSSQAKVFDGRCLQGHSGLMAWTARNSLTCDMQTRKVVRHLPMVRVDPYERTSCVMLPRTAASGVLGWSVLCLLAGRGRAVSRTTTPRPHSLPRVRFRPDCRRPARPQPSSGPLFVFVLVEGALIYAIFRFRGKPDDPGAASDPRQHHGRNHLDRHSGSDSRRHRGADSPGDLPDQLATARRRRLEIEVVGHQWWWEFRYPELQPHHGQRAARAGGADGVAPDGDARTSSTASGSPQFAAKRDVFPNRETRLWFKAEAGGRVSGAVRRVLRHPARPHGIPGSGHRRRRSSRPGSRTCRRCGPQPPRAKPPPAARSAIPAANGSRSRVTAGAS